MIEYYRGREPEINRTLDHDKLFLFLVAVSLCDFGMVMIYFADDPYIIMFLDYMNNQILPILRTFVLNFSIKV